MTDIRLLAASFATSGKLWKAATAEVLYRAAVGLALKAEEENPGLDVEKGTDLFLLGLAQLTQEKDDEGVHHVLRAIEECRRAGREYDQETSKQALGRTVVGPVRKALDGPARLCRQSGHTAITSRRVDRMVQSMFRASRGGPYDPTFALWLYRATRRSQDLPHLTQLTQLRRLEALQGMTFFYEAGLKQRLGLTGCTLSQLVREVCKAKQYPQVPQWATYASFDRPRSAYTHPDAARAVLERDFGKPPGSPGAFAEQALYVLGLVRNMTHHQMNQGWAILNADHDWVREHLLAALLLSW